MRFESGNSSSTFQNAEDKNIQNCNYETKRYRRTTEYSLLYHKRDYILGTIDMVPIEKRIRKSDVEVSLAPLNAKVTKLCVLN